MSKVKLKFQQLNYSYSLNLKMRRCFFFEYLNLQCRLFFISQTKNPDIVPEIIVQGPGKNGSNIHSRKHFSLQLSAAIKGTIVKISLR
jgi:hypothetical protein